MTSVSTRRPALDGLRGLAALVVVVCHSLLIAPVFADAYRGILPRTGTWQWMLTSTPLHLFWAGNEAVLVFFILSGFVLTLPFASGQKFIVRSYYVKRLLRLYVPVLASCFFALLLIKLVHRVPSPTSSWWLLSHDSAVAPKEFVKTALVFWGGTGLLGVLWSLKWEVIFSLSLPALLFFQLRSRRGTSAVVLGLASLSVFGNETNHPALTYLPVFGYGIVMAHNLGHLDRIGVMFDGLRHVTRVCLVMGFLALVVSRWWLPALLGIRTSSLVDAGATVMTQAGACFIVWLFMSTAWGRALGTQLVISRLGKRSFSLYLVHESVVVTVAFSLHGTTNAIVVLAIALPLSLVVAEVFGRMVEGPSQLLAKSAGRRVEETIAFRSTS